MWQKMAVDSKSTFVSDLGTGQQQEIRSEQVENAVGFLSHPKVRGSPVSSKREFLKGKGLTEAEIDEAFRRVPEIEQQTQSYNVGDINQAMKSATAPISKVVAQSPVGTPIQATQPGYSWLNVFLGFAFAGTTAYSVRKILGPVISRTVGRSSSSPPAGSEERRGRKEEEVPASQELIEAIRSQTEQMRDSLDSLKELIDKNGELSVISSSLSELRKEVNSIASKLEEDRTSEQPPKTTAASSRMIGNGTDAAAKDFEDSVESSNPQHPVSYMEVLEMLERGQTPPGIRDDINDKAPNPQVTPPPARLRPLPKPWKREASSEKGGLYAGDASGISGGEEEGSNSFIPTTVPEDDAQSLSISTLVRDVGTSASIFESATSPIRHSRSVIVGKLSPPSALEKREKSEGDREGIISEITEVSQPYVSEISSSSRKDGDASLSNSQGIPDGSGLGRPFSKGWKPPPLPSPSLN
eukprot:jgi/Picsp_1/6553/NSC_03896-R1_peroxin pex14